MCRRTTLTKRGRRHGHLPRLGGEVDEGTWVSQVTSSGVGNRSALAGEESQKAESVASVTRDHARTFFEEEICMEVFREMLKLYRTTNNLTTTELARTIGIPRSTLSQFESRRDGTKGTTLARMLCWALNDPSVRRH
jgi:DNA-binding XRE family transcriptional regulator